MNSNTILLHPFSLNSDEHEVLVQNAKVGTWLYLVIWLAIVFWGDLLQRVPLLTTLMTVCLVLLASVRFSLVHHFTRWYLHYPLAWVCGMYCCILFSGLLWGGMTAIALSSLSFQSLAVALLAATAGFISASCVLYTFSGLLTMGYQTCLLFPPLVTLWLQGGETNYWLSGLLLAYWFGMVAIFWVQHKQYRLLTHQQHAPQLTEKRLCLTEAHPITGWVSFGYLPGVVNAEVKRSSRSGAPLALLKLVMTPQGERKLDKDEVESVHTELASVINSAVTRASDWIFYDENGSVFMVLPETPAAAACHMADKIINCLPKTLYQHYLFSIGVLAGSISWPVSSKILLQRLASLTSDVHRNQQAVAFSTLT
ncbi:hypothetical protein [Zooshikella harenae]|uniref:GGDEF domain-containing protein n=1 Tax=Zooshikella harenae TaxID=2827238 RepID=A0ABS5Z9D6_9GAMM|nr:hypothetical protein [Zooshikella harenae]MBU2710660.1 hypothetical protein [Zooshikella harenae]